MDISVAEKLRLIMKRQNMTMGELAEASGQTRQNLSNKMTRGKRPGFGEQVSVWYVIQSRSVSVPAAHYSVCG